VIGQYHAQGIVPLRRWPLRLCEMTADRAHWEGTVTVPLLPSLLEVQRRMAQAIERSTYSWSPSRLLPTLPNARTKNGELMSSRLLTVKFRQPSHEFTFGVDMSFISYPLVLTPLI
jgi:hypothetical protein